MSRRKEYGRVYEVKQSLQLSVLAEINEHYLNDPTTETTIYDELSRIAWVIFEQARAESENPSTQIVAINNLIIEEVNALLEKTTPTTYRATTKVALITLLSKLANQNRIWDEQHFLLPSSQHVETFWKWVAPSLDPQPRTQAGAD